MTNEECFDKYQFNLHYTKPHPKYRDSMTFNGLEADYVVSLEVENSRLRSQVDLLLSELNCMRELRK